jgi:hypothetical protein
MCAHPDTVRGDFTQEGVEPGAVAPFVDGIDPYEHAIKRGELSAHGVEDIILVDHRFGVDANVAERREDSLEPAGLWRRVAARRCITAPQDSDAAKGRLEGRFKARFGLRHGNDSAFKTA